MNLQKKLWLNGKIYTVNEEQPFAEALITFNDKIIFAGSNEDAIKAAGDDAEVFDFKNKLVLPGFIDSHVHFMIGGLSLTRLDLSDVNSKDEFINSVESFSRQNKSEWILGGNWNHLQFREKELPRKSWIDSAVSDRPLYLTRIDIHTALVNSKALEFAGITKDTADPQGGKIHRDSETGEPTGILIDSAMKLVADLIPEPTEKDYENALKAAMNEAAKNGITGVHDITERKYFPFYQSALNNNRLTTRINAIHPINHVDDFVNLGITHSFGNNKLRTGCLKAFADGSLGSNTAWFFEPYKDDPSTNGLPTDYMSNGQFKKWALKADLNKLQLAIHAIGDRAVSEVLNIFEEIVKTNPAWDRRFRIEHVQHIKEKDIDRMKKLNVIASMQPAQLYDDGVWAEEKIGKERLKGTHAVKTLIDNGIRVCLGSDWTVTPLNVIHGIDIAVNRKTKGERNPNGWIPSEKISVEQAVKAYTLNAAYASFEENIKGSLEPGKLADFVLLDRNIFEIDKNEICDTKVELTVLGGEVVSSD